MGISSDDVCDNHIIISMAHEVEYADIHTYYLQCNLFADNRAAFEF